MFVITRSSQCIVGADHYSTPNERATGYQHSRDGPMRSMASGAAQIAHASQNDAVCLCTGTYRSTCLTICSMPTSYRMVKVGFRSGRILKPQNQVTALIGRNTSTNLIRRLCDGHPDSPKTGFGGGATKVFCVPVQHAFAVTASCLAFHESTERFDWLIGSQQGD